LNPAAATSAYVWSRCDRAHNLAESIGNIRHGWGFVCDFFVAFVLLIRLLAIRVRQLAKQKAAGKWK
jgi:hypothetical protein